MSALLGSYSRADISFTHGEGVWLIAENGQRYLDFTSGVGVNALGHAHPKLVETLKAQSEKLWHVSNLFNVPEQEALGQSLVESTFADKVFFCNSGAEAIELSIKMARKTHSDQGHPEKYRIITFNGAFHGRTLATIAAGGNPNYYAGFGPKVDGFDHIEPEDLDAAQNAITSETAGFLVEPVQGEGGVRALSDEFLRGLRALCDANGLVLIYDEVQCGVGRTGQLFAYQWSDAEPDIMAVAKGLGGGFPIGACLAKDKVAKAMVPGTHGSTFGGNPLATAVGQTVLDEINTPEFLQHVQDMSEYLEQKLQALKEHYHNHIVELRGRGLMRGLRLNIPVGDVVARLRDQNMLAVVAGENVLRLLPPLIIEKEHQAVDLIGKALSQSN